MRFSKPLGAAGAALLTAVALTGCGAPSTAAGDPLDDREAYRDTLRLWLQADPAEKAAVCQAVLGTDTGTQPASLPVSGDLLHDTFDAEFLTGRC